MSDLVVAEIANQPECWRKGARFRGAAPLLPVTGRRVAVMGRRGASWFIAMAYAALREAAGKGWTDACAASEFPVGRFYDVVLAISRSGTPTELPICWPRGTETL